MSETIKSNKDECVLSDRQSPYSQPSLSPPLTPPGEDYHYQQQPLYQRSYPFSTPLNYSTFSRECGTSFVESEEYFERGKLEYCVVKKAGGYYDNYYDYAYYHQPRSQSIHNNFHYQ